jgi:vancomycin resistance protein YoaR
MELTLLKASVAFTVDKPREIAVDRVDKPGADATVDIPRIKVRFKEEIAEPILTVDKPRLIVVLRVLTAGVSTSELIPGAIRVESDERPGA